MIELGKRFVVMGDWDTNPEPEGKIIIRMPVAPHHTYGCWNKTTQMCIEALEERVAPGMTVLDFGTGSGILAMVAWHLGAEKIYWTESNPHVAEFAQEVWRLNRIQIPLTPKKLPEVDFCVANVGDALAEVRHLIKARELIYVTNKGELKDG